MRKHISKNMNKCASTYEYEYDVNKTVYKSNHVYENKTYSQT